mgnify:CR=1 FL=1
MRHFNINNILLIIALVFLTGCYSHRNIGYLQERDDLPHYEKDEYKEYRLQVNDAVIYRLITMDETISKVMQSNSTNSLSNNNSIYYRIYPDSTIDLPFLSSVKIGGMTIPEAEEEVQRRMREIVPDAEVRLDLYNKTFTVIGDMSSGTYQIYKEKMTIFQALAMTGDVMNSGDRRHVRIIRPRTNEKPEVLEFDLRTNSIIDSKYYYIQPNDVIYVQRDKNSFYKVANYASFTSLVTSSLSLLISVLSYVK